MISHISVSTACGALLFVSQLIRYGLITFRKLCGSHTNIFHIFDISVSHSICLRVCSPNVAHDWRLVIMRES